MRWVKIPNHENYEINELGEVRFLGKTVTHKNGCVHTYPPRKCNPIWIGSGYGVSCDGDAVPIAITVARLFIPNPRGLKRIYHVDGNIANNSATNIIWGARENVVLDNSKSNEKEWLMSNYNVTVDGRVIRKSDGFEITASIDKKGYKVVRLKAPMFSKNKDMRKGYKVHRLVAMYYLEDYSDDLQVNHINGNKQDNRVENIEMTTNAQNVWHAWNVLDSSERRRKLSERNREAAKKRLIEHQRQLTLF